MTSRQPERGRATQEVWVQQDAPHGVRQMAARRPHHHPTSRPTHMLIGCPGASPPLGKGTASWVSRKVGKASSRCFNVSLSYSAFRFNHSSRASLLTSLPYDSCLFAQCICHTMGNGTPGDVMRLRQDIDNM